MLNFVALVLFLVFVLLLFPKAKLCCVVSFIIEECKKACFVAHFDLSVVLFLDLVKEKGTSFYD